MTTAALARNGASAPFGADRASHVTHASLLSGYRELVIDLGGNPELLLASAGLCEAEIREPLAQVPVRSIGQLLEDTATALGCPDFGLRMAERQSMEAVMKPLDRLIQTAPTVRDALEHCCRHVGAYNSGLAMEIASHDADSCDFDCGDFGGTEPAGLYMVDFKLLNGLSLYPQFIEQLILHSHKSIAWLSAGFAHSRMILFSHLNIAAPVDYTRRFNTVVRFGQEYDAILLNEEDLETRITGADAKLFAWEAELAAMRFPARERDIETKVRQAIFQALTRSDECSRHNIARLLGFQERTLNRHLYKKGTSFEAIRDEVRRDLACRYLARADLSLSDVAGRLGYSELAVLSRCCQRWFGAPPRQLRQSLLASRQSLPSPPHRPSNRAVPALPAGARPSDRARPTTSSSSSRFEGVRSPA